MRFWSAIASAALLLAIGGEAKGQTSAPDRCARLLDAYELAEKQKSYWSWAGVGDNSAFRETNRNMAILNENITQMMLIEMMGRANCRMPENLPSTNRYWRAAADCVQARGEEAMRQACNRANWRPSN
jgi:hypothetical protein